MNAITISPVLFWPAFAAFWAILLAAVGSTVWLMGRLSGKVDWHVYERNQTELQSEVTGLRTDVATLLERSKLQNKLIEHFLNNNPIGG